MSRTGSHPSRRWTGTRPIDGRPTAPSLPATASGPPAVGTSVFPTAHHEPGYCMKREFFGRNAAFRGAYSRQGLDGDGLGGRFGAIEMVAGGRFRAAAAPSGALGATRPDPPPHPHNPPSGLIRAVAPSVATPLPPPPNPLSHRPRLSTRAGDRSGLAQVLRALQHPPSIHSLPNSAYGSFYLSPFRLIFVLEKTHLFRRCFRWRPA